MPQVKSTGDGTDKNMFYLNGAFYTLELSLVFHVDKREFHSLTTFAFITE